MCSGKIINLLPVILSLFLMSFMGCAVGNKEEGEKEEGIISYINNIKGYVRVIGEEEYKLYEEITRMTNSGNISEEELEEKTKAYAERINAIFYLGNRLDIYEPYSLDVLRFRMEQENTKRKEKLENNEPVYGLQQFEERTFLQYELENLISDIKVEILGKLTREELADGPREYYEAHEDEFKSLESITYEVNQDGKKEILTTDRMGLRSMRNLEPAFLDFINVSQEGDVYKTMTSEGEEITKTILEMKYGEMGYENHEENAVIAYMERILFDQLINIVAENNPVSFYYESLE